LWQSPTDRTDGRAIKEKKRKPAQWACECDKSGANGWRGVLVPPRTPPRRILSYPAVVRCTAPHRRLGGLLGAWHHLGWTDDS